MTISSAVAANLGQLIKEFSPAYYARGINQASPLLNSGQLKKEDADGDEYVVTLFPSANHATGWLLDGGRLPAGGGSLPVKARAMPRAVVSVISQGRAAAKMGLAASKIIKMLDAEMKERSADVGRSLNRSLIGGQISPSTTTSWSAAGAPNSTNSLDFIDVSLFRPGQAVDYVRNGDKSYIVRVTAVAPKAVGGNSANVGGTVSFINDVPVPDGTTIPTFTAATVTTSDIFAVRGTFPGPSAGIGGTTTAQAARSNSFDDMAGSTTFNTIFMNVDPAVSTDVNWVAQYLNLNAAYSQEAALAFAARIATFSDATPDTCVMHPQLAAAHRAATDFHGGAFGVSPNLTAGRPLSLDKSTDKYGAHYDDDGLRVSGAKVIQDPNCMATRAIFFNSEWTKLAVWAEMGPDGEADDPVLLGRTFYTNEVQISGLYNLVTDKRSTVGILDNITGL